MEDVRCVGCGAIIQSEDSEKPGYLPKSALDNNHQEIICRRCFRLRHYNEVTPVTITQEDFYKVVSEIGKTNSLVVNIIDLFDIEGSMIPQIAKLTNHNDLLIIANKRDLLPKSINNSKLIHQIKKILATNNFKPIDIFLMSATKRHGLDIVMEKMLKLANNRDIYVVGATNVGKSTFVNAILKSYAGAKEDIITVSQAAGTTLDMIKIPLDDHYLVDTPGIINDIQLTHYVSTKSLKVITPKKEIKPKVYQLFSGQTLFLNGFARIDFFSGEKTNFVCYVSEFIKIHRTKLANADNLYQNRRYEVLSPPFEGEEYRLKKYRFDIKQKEDLVLPGLGFITIKGPCVIHVFVHEKTRPYVREALI
jgi:ribosome biogenesis GTPase YqeH